MAITAAIAAPFLSGLFAYLTTRGKGSQESRDKREERWSAEAREMLTGYRSDIAALRIELRESEGRAEERERRLRERVDQLQGLVDTQHSAMLDQDETIRGHERTIREQQTTIDGQATELATLRAQVAQLQAGGREPGC